MFLLFYVRISLSKNFKSITISEQVKGKNLYKHRKKYYDHPNKYLSLIIDGMDQKKTFLPHFLCTPKKLQEENLVVWSLKRRCCQGFTSQLQIFIMMQILP